MNFLSFLYQIIIAPIEMIIEWIFIFYRNKIKIGGAAGAIVAVSLGVNFLALPLYNIADKLQEKERNLQLSLSKWVKHIKTYFKGDERFMMLQAYYRENNYHPLYALRSSLSILIEIPFFIAAYHFLSHSTSLYGAHFAFIKNFGVPDGLLYIPFITSNGIRINVLPILMTLINFISGAIYLKKAPLKEKIQLYGLALVFLFLLYNSPSGLVCYWILNNIFSLFKNIVNEKVKKPRKLVHIILSFLLVLMACYLMLNNKFNLKKRILFLMFAFIFTAFPYVFAFIRKRLGKNSLFEITDVNPTKTNLYTFIFSAIGMTLLLGFLVPSQIIFTSPLEFSFIGNTDSPLTYIFTSISFYFGLFFFWPFVIYKIFNDKVKLSISFIWPALFFMALLNIFIFKHDYGTFSIFFKLEEEEVLRVSSFFLNVLPFIAFAAIIVVLQLIKKFNFQKYLNMLLVAFFIAEFSIGAYKTININKSYKEYAKTYTKTDLSGNSADNDRSNIQPAIHLSKTQNNVIVFFIDRAVSSFLPYYVEEFPELEDQFAGFTYYPNTVSFSSNTAKAAPALMGGYEYTPENMNKRADEFLQDKHNEASLVMPKLFLDAGYDVTVLDPPVPNYSWKGDFTAFETYPQIHVQDLQGKYDSVYLSEHPELVFDNPDYYIKKNLKAFVLMESFPPSIRNTYYVNGNYYTENDDLVHNEKTTEFIHDYTGLYYLPELTAADNTSSAFVFMDNETPHRGAVLKNHEYTPIKEEEKEIICGSYDWKIKPYSEYRSDAELYYVTAATILQVGKWLDYLKDNDVYDNTRIVIVSDHGYEIPTPGFNGMKHGNEYARFNPLFMVKDFNNREKLKTDYTLMTNADTLIFATQDLPVSDKNPFTGIKYADCVEKETLTLYPAIRAKNFVEWNSTYLKDKKLWAIDDSKNHFTYYKVHDDIFNEDNWERIVK